MGGSKKDRTKKQQKKRVTNKNKMPSRVIDQGVRLQASLFQRPSSFNSFADLAEFASSCVFVISRLRKIDNNQTQLTTLGTGFLVGRNRLMTCAHVIDAEGGHQEDDLYLIAQRNPPAWYQSFQKFEIDQSLFIYPANDSAIMYLSDGFYFNEQGDELRSPDHYLQLSSRSRRIGTDVGILGYPLQSLAFLSDGTDVDLNGIILKADKGVVNTAYTDARGTSMYEFTMGFNPGNSGGPIMDLATGEVIAMVHGYQSIPINATLDFIPAGTVAGVEEDNHVISTVRALYSLGLSSENYLTYAKKHGIDIK